MCSNFEHWMDTSKYYLSIDPNSNLTSENRGQIRVSRKKIIIITTINRIVVV